MAKSSIEHLNLMNVMIGFSLNLETFPKPLRNCGYSTELIEPTFGDNGTPDLFFNSKKGGLVCDCKTSKAEEPEEPFKGIENVKKYDKISILQLTQKGVNITYEEKDIDLSLSLSSKRDYGNFLVEKEINYPIISFNLNGHASFAEKKLGNKFKDDSLNTEFLRKINFNYDQRPEVVPFLENNIHEIQEHTFDTELRKELDKTISQIYSIFVSRTIKGKTSFEVMEITKEIFGDMWENFDAKKMRLLTKKILAILIFLRDSGALEYTDLKTKSKKQFLKKSRGESTWQIDIGTHPKRLDKFRNTKKEAIESLSQEKLFKYFKNNNQEED